MSRGKSPRDDVGSNSLTGSQGIASNNHV